MKSSKRIWQKILKKSVELHGTKKVTIRVDRNVYDFYESLSLDCTTAMKKSLANRHGRYKGSKH